jgi:purine nucleoside phosphorylase
MKNQSLAEVRPDEGRYAIIAGSGFADLAGGRPGRRPLTGFGLPEAPVREFQCGGRPVLYLARHGEAIDVPAHRVNYRANLSALRLLGVSRIVAVNTVGVIRAGLRAGDLAVPAQLIDYTYGRDHSIHEGKSARLEHVDFTEPLCSSLRAGLLAASREAGVACHEGGVYAVTQGPRLETAAEIDRLERDGADFVGMTLMPEASIARELGIRFACLSLIVNAAAGRGEKGIYDDIDASMESAKSKALDVLEAFFARAGRP